MNPLFGDLQKEAHQALFGEVLFQKHYTQNPFGSIHRLFEWCSKHNLSVAFLPVDTGEKTKSRCVISANSLLDSDIDPNHYIRVVADTWYEAFYLCCIKTKRELL